MAASADALAVLVVHLHLPAILAAAAPPLGQTGRLLIALGLAGLGGGLGLLIGLMLHARAPLSGGKAIRAKSGARSSAAMPDDGGIAGKAAEASPSQPSGAQAMRVRNRDAHPDAPPRRPLVVTEDVLPYAVPEVARSIVAPPAWIAAELSQDAPDQDAPDQDAPDQDGPDNTGPDKIDADHDDADAPLGAFVPPVSTPIDHADNLPPFLAAALAATRSAAAPAPLSPVDPIILPVEPVAPTPDPLCADIDADAADKADAVDAAPHAQSDGHAATAPLPLASQAAAAPQAPIAEVPLASLGLVQLIERLALAIAARQARQTVPVAAVSGSAPVAPAADAVDPRMPLHRFDPLTMDPTGPLLRAKPARLGRIGDSAPEADAETPPAGGAPLADAGVYLHDPLGDAGLAAHTWAEADDEDLPPPSLARFLGGSVGRHVVDAESFDPMPVEAFDGDTGDGDTGDSDPADEPEDGETGAAEARYSSLVTMAMPRPELVAVAPVRGHGDRDGAHEDGPVVPFPVPPTRLPGTEARSIADGAESPSESKPTDRDQADRALRDALATLRRMSAQR
ncbi:hypothetical protein AQZ50_13170 [Novosphingobium sp. Fuku2-ISO-50]|nr:hypothetical protein AQZ50_13170 [Novosphingobium sp. Fuku2-ISO-50]